MTQTNAEDIKLRNIAGDRKGRSYKKTFLSAFVIVFCVVCVLIIT